MKKYDKVDIKIFETMKADLIQAFEVLDSKQNPERYKIDFAMLRIGQVVAWLDKHFLSERG